MYVVRVYFNLGMSGYVIKILLEEMAKLYYSKFAKDHFFDFRYFVHIITIYIKLLLKVYRCSGLINM